MIIAAFILPILGYALVYASILNLRSGPGGIKTGVLEVMRPGFDVRTRLTKTARGSEFANDVEKCIGIGAAIKLTRAEIEAALEKCRAEGRIQ